MCGTSVAASQCRRYGRGPLVYLALWYLGNYYYNIFNKNAGKASGGAEFAFTLATIQLVVGSIYCLFLWSVQRRVRHPR